MAHILPGPQQYQCEACGQPLPRFTTEPSAPPGWTCPSCRHSYAPWVPECRHCPESPAATPILETATGNPVAVDLRLRLPGEWASPHHQRIARVGRTWSEVLPGLQCYARNPIPDEDGGVTLCLRLTREDAHA